METVNQEEIEFIPDYLSRLEETVLEELSSREKNYSFRFNGLRRLLKDVHQQKLSRALERLQEDRLIEQYPDGGYGLGNNAEIIRKHFGKQRPYNDYLNLNSPNQEIITAVAQNNDIPVNYIIDKLAGKYFGAFRFVGHYFSNGKGRLEWIHAEDHAKILISSISPSTIEIIAQNVSKGEMNKIVRIIQQMLLDHQIPLNFTESLPSQAN